MFLCAEVALRIVQRLTRGTPILSMLPGAQLKAFRRSPFLVFGPRVHDTLPGSGDPAWRTFNERGLRFPFRTPDRATGELRILVLGGSTSEDAQNALGIHWPLGLECLQRARGRTDLRVLNGGMSAFSTAHSLVQYQLDLADTRPDFVFVLHNINDLIVQYHALAQGKALDPTYLVRYGRKRFTGVVDDHDIVYSRVAHSLSARIRPESKGVPYTEWQYDLSEAERLFRRNLRSLVLAIRHSGATPVLLTMPRSSNPGFVDAARQVRGDVGLTHFPEMERFLSDFARFNEIVREVAGQDGALLADVAAAYPDSVAYFADMVHYNTEGVRRFARIIDSLSTPFLPPSSGAVLPAETRVTCEGVI